MYFSFFIYSAALGAMFPRLGDLQLKMGISEGTLGFALVGLPFGAQIALMFGGRVLEFLGYRKVMLLGIPLMGLSEVAASTASTPLMFFLYLIVGGLGIGVVEVAVNLEADRVEHQMGHRIMNRSHAFWSFGFFAAGFTGAAISQWEIDVTYHLIGFVIVTSLATFVVLLNYEPAPSRQVIEGGSPTFVRPTKGIMMIVAFTLSAMLLEGAGIDWSVIFMRDTFQTAPFISGSALAIGALTQAMVRFFADSYVDRFGATTIAKLSIFTLGVGVVMVTFSPNFAIALIGFGLMGMGHGVVFPLAMSAAAQRTDRPAAVNVAALAQLAFITFLIAPPLLGTIAEHFGIRISFGIGIPLVALSWFFVGSLASKGIEQ
ncbi:MAG: MFS transporter [Paracoccaceae bacterium]